MSIEKKPRLDFTLNAVKYKNPTQILVLGWKSAPFRPRREIINIPKEILVVLGGNLGAKVGISPEITYFIKIQGFYENHWFSLILVIFAILEPQIPKIHIK